MFENQDLKFCKNLKADTPIQNTFSSFYLAVKFLMTTRINYEGTTFIGMSTVSMKHIFIVLCLQALLMPAHNSTQELDLTVSHLTSFKWLWWRWRCYLRCL